MKNKIKLIKCYVTSALILLFSACTDFLDNSPTDFITEDQFWKDANNALDALTGCYRVLNDVGQYGGYTDFMLECLTPNAYHKDNYYNTHDFAIGSHSGTTLGLNLAWWETCYKGIGRCNYVIEYVPRIEMDENLKTRIIGEAKFLRAFFYWKLNFVFHGVPLILEAPDVDSQKDLARNSYEEVRSQILKDLDDAIPVLEVEYPSNEDGRATRGAALALKALVMIADEDFNGAISACKEIVELNRYELFPDYNGMFREKNTGNSEIIFDVRWKYPLLYENYDIYSTQYNIQVPVQELVDEYEMIDGKSIAESDLYDPDKPFENRDPRLEQTMSWIGRPWRGGIATAADWHQTGYGFVKFTEYNAETQGTLTDSSTPYVIFRYGGILLLYAEAINEVEGPSALVYQLINEVRGRESVNMPPIPEGLSKEEMREAIRKERRIELAGEGDYFYSIRRWKIAEEVMNGNFHAGPFDPYNNSIIESRQFTERDYLWPIPYTEIDLNPNLKQNPGY